MTQLIHADKYFATARERYRIKLKRDAGESWPWSKDSHFQTWSFTNVHREMDKTTVWLRENIREPLIERYKTDTKEFVDLKIVESIMVFRWFNRISTGEIIKDLLLNKWDSREAHRRLVDVNPIFTGAYVIVGVPGQSKLDGVLEAIDAALPQLPFMVPHWGTSLEETWKDLKTINYQGGFTAYEIVMDLRYTPVLEKAKDTMLWGNLGPGAIRGMSWVLYGNADSLNNSVSGQKQMLSWMTELLEMSKLEENWPQIWPHWEMHEIEMWLCEHAKYMRSYEGYRQKRRYQR